GGVVTAVVDRDRVGQRAGGTVVRPVDVRGVGAGRDGDRGHQLGAYRVRARPRRLGGRRRCGGGLGGRCRLGGGLAGGTRLVRGRGGLRLRGVPGPCRRRLVGRRGRVVPDRMGGRG